MYLESTNIIKQYSSFSELVSNALEVLIKKNAKEQYKKSIIEASKDKLYLQDLKEIEENLKKYNKKNKVKIHIV